MWKILLPLHRLNHGPPFLEAIQPLPSRAVGLQEVHSMSLDIFKGVAGELVGFLLFLSSAPVAPAKDRALLHPLLSSTWWFFFFTSNCGVVLP